MKMNKYVKNFLNYKFLLIELVKKGIKLKYRRSYLGIVWSLLEPLLTMIVLSIVFGTLYGNTTKAFPIYILAGRLLYSFFSLGTTSALKSIRTHAAIIKKVYVPKYLYTISSIIFNYIIFLISLVVLVGVCFVLGVFPKVSWLLMPVPLILLFILTCGCGLILATIGVFFRDVEYLWSVFLMIIMYTCAIFYYPEKILVSGVSWILNINPLYCIIMLFRSIIFNNPIELYGLIYSTVFSILTMCVGIVVFKKNQDKFILYI